MGKEGNGVDVEDIMRGATAGEWCGEDLIVRIIVGSVDSGIDDGTDDNINGRFNVGTHDDIDSSLDGGINFRF